MRVLGQNGKLLGEPRIEGFLNLSEMIKSLSLLRGEVAEFESAEHADSAALVAGWKVKDEDGTPNHRCRGCRIAERAEEYVKRTGDYIYWDD